MMGCPLHSQQSRSCSHAKSSPNFERDVTECECKFLNKTKKTHKNLLAGTPIHLECNKQKTAYRR